MFEEFEEGETCEDGEAVEEVSGAGDEGEAVEEVSAAGDETLSALNEVAPSSVSSTAAGEPAIPPARVVAIGETDGTAVCTGTLVPCCGSARRRTPSAAVF